MTEWLQEGLDRLIRAVRSDDLAEYSASYDDCLWRVVTSDGEGLRPLVQNAWLEPYSSLPIPLVVVACRFFALATQESDKDRFAALQFIAAHCTPEEERGALDGTGVPAGFWMRPTEPPIDTPD